VGNAAMNVAVVARLRLAVYLVDAAGEAGKRLHARRERQGPHKRALRLRTATQTAAAGRRGCRRCTLAGTGTRGHGAAVRRMTGGEGGHGQARRRMLAAPRDAGLPRGMLLETRGWTHESGGAAEVEVATSGRAVQGAPGAQQVVYVLLDQRRRVLRQYLKAVTKKQNCECVQDFAGHLQTRKNLFGDLQAEGVAALVHHVSQQLRGAESCSAQQPAGG
jgi:hypothetical protein